MNYEPIGDKQVDAAATEFLVAPRLSEGTPVYYDQMNEILEWYTGSSETYLTREQEQELAGMIQTGIAAEAELKNTYDYEDQDALSPEMRLLINQVEAGKEAELMLFECNLKLAHWMARVSMGLHPEVALPTGTNGRRLRRPSRMSTASLDDRTQNAGIGLLKAVRAYRPGEIGRDGEVVKFSSFAKPVMINTINDLSPKDEDQISIPVDIQSDIAIAFPQNPGKKVKNFTPKKLKALITADIVRNTASLDRLYAKGGAPEENPAEEIGSLILSADEVIPDPDTPRPEELPRREVLNEVIENRLSEREAHVIRLRFGLTGDQMPHTLEEVGKSIGLPRESARQIEAKALWKLRSVPLDTYLLLLNMLYDEEPEALPMRSGDVVTWRNTIGKTTLHLLNEPSVSPES